MGLEEILVSYGGTISGKNLGMTNFVKVTKDDNAF
jgi:hypothetical protein